jgi:DNA-directed RNA polymerase subunit RPC12/RpoP
MYNEKTVVVACPDCGQKIEYTVLNAIDSDAHPFQKQALVNGTLFELNCNSCGSRIDLLYDFVYRDLENNVIIYFTEGEKVEGVCTALSLSANLDMVDGVKIEDFPAIRVVSDYDVLREKIDIFDNALDDRVIELVKALCVADAIDKIPNLNVHEAYFVIVDGVMKIELHGEGGIAISDFSRETYDKIESDFSEYLAADTSLIVNSDWALAILNDDEDDDGTYEVTFEDDK